MAVRAGLPRVGHGGCPENLNCGLTAASPGAVALVMRPPDLALTVEEEEERMRSPPHAVSASWELSRGHLRCASVRYSATKVGRYLPLS